MASCYGNGWEVAPTRRICIKSHWWVPASYGKVDILAGMHAGRSMCQKQLQTRVASLLHSYSERQLF